MGDANCPFSHSTLTLCLSTPDQSLRIMSLSCFVDGKPFNGSSSFEVKDPHSGKVLHKVSSITADDVPTVADAAVAAFPAWRAMSISERRKIVFKAADLLKERLPEFAKIEFEETTSTQGWAGFDFTLALGGMEEAAACASSALQGESVPSENGQKVYVEREPYGVVLAMAPWNAPGVLTQRAFVQPLLAGNTVILKTSEMSPKTQMVYAKLFMDAGLPAGVLNIVHVAPADAAKTVEALIAHPAVGKLNFTGSTRVGSIIASTAGKHLKPTVMELGGKAPVIVRADANIKAAANGIAFGGWFHSGQICMATQTVIAHESIKDELQKEIKACADRLAAGPQDAPLSGLFTNASAQHAAEVIKDAVSKGAQIAAGKNEVEGNVVQPVMFEGVTKDMRLYGEEMFAPVFSFLTYTDDEKAVEIANDHEYGLSAGIWTGDIATALRLGAGIKSGAVHVNGSSVHDAGHVPHGGWRKSGWGRFNGIHGIREWTQLKTYTINPIHGQYPI